MITPTFCLRRRPLLSREEFQGSPSWAAEEHAVV